MKVRYSITIELDIFHVLKKTMWLVCFRGSKFPIFVSKCSALCWLAICWLIAGYIHSWIVWYLWCYTMFGWYVQSGIVGWSSPAFWCIYPLLMTGLICWWYWVNEWMRGKCLLCIILFKVGVISLGTLSLVCILRVRDLLEEFGRLKMLLELF